MGVVWAQFTAAANKDAIWVRGHGIRGTDDWGLPPSMMMVTIEGVALVHMPHTVQRGVKRTRWLWVHATEVLWELRRHGRHCGGAARGVRVPERSRTGRPQKDGARGAAGHADGPGGTGHGARLHRVQLKKWVPTGPT